MSIFPRTIEDKHCFMPCPPDRCNCKVGNPLEWARQQAVLHPVAGQANCPDCGSFTCDGCGALAKIDHIIAIEKAAVRYPGCWNKPRPTTSTTYTAQAGWREYEERGEVIRVPVLVLIPHRMSTTCQYDKSATDAGCSGCVHGEQRPC